MHIRQLVLGELDTNCYVVWDETGECLIIDPADDADAILQEVTQNNLTVTAVVLSHVHFDHMLAAEALCAATNAPLYVGAGDEDALSNPVRNLSGLFTPGKSVTLQKDKLLHDNDLLTVGNMAFTVWETPGHTPGCICLKCEDTLFSGDTLFEGSIGRLDFPGGNPTDMFRSLQRLMTLPADTKVYSGHGDATTIGREQKYNPYLR